MLCVQVMIRNVRAMSMHFAPDELGDSSDDDDVGDEGVIEVVEGGDGTGIGGSHHGHNSISKSRMHNSESRSLLSRAKSGKSLYVGDDITGLGEEVDAANQLEKLVEKRK